MWLNVHKRMGFGGAEFYFWDEFPGRLPLPGKRFRAMGGLGGKKFSPCHLYLADIEWNIRTSANVWRKLGHLRT